MSNSVIDIAPMTLDDIGFFNETRNLSCDMLHDNSTFTYEESMEWFLKKQPDYYIIRHITLGRIGYFRTSNYSQQNKNIYIGADLHPQFRGKGYAYSAYQIFMSFIFNKYNLHKISLEVLSINSTAMNLYTKLGFKIDGIKRQEVYRNNIFIDSIIMSILRNELL